MTKKLYHPYPDETFGFNAFVVLFGMEAGRAHMDLAQVYLGTDENGEAILEPINQDLLREMYKLCAEYSGATIDEVKAFLKNLPKRVPS